MLLLALWVRSYWQGYQGWVIVGSKTYVAMPICGQFACGVVNRSLSSSQSFAISSLDPQQISPRSSWLLRVRPSGWQAVVPMWLPVAVFSLLAGAPWFRVPKQFSLRTLLIITTLVAVLLGLVVWSINSDCGQVLPRSFRL